VGIERIFYGETSFVVTGDDNASSATLDVEIDERGANALAHVFVVGFEMNGSGAVKSGVRQVRFYDSSGKLTATDFAEPPDGEMPAQIYAVRMTGVTFGFHIYTQGFAFGKSGFQISILE
jgi:hypothetical protein